MRDVVLVPCYERPEYTRVCLEYLSRARGIEDKDIWLFLDNHKGDDFEKIFDGQQSNFDLANFGSCQLPHDTYGNSKNIIDGLKAAYESGAERIFLVEDDIMVAPDIFEWHEAILEGADPFVSCASALNKSAHFQINGPDKMDELIKDPNAYKLVRGPYSSHAAAFTRSKLRLFIAADLKDIEWCSGREQDIWMQHVMKLLYGYSVWPYVPRAFNVGMTSYHINTGMKFNGTLEEKCETLRKAIVNPEKLRSMSGGNQTITPVPTEFVERTGPLVCR